MPILLLLPDIRTFCASLAPDRYEHLCRSVTAACLCASLFPWTGRMPRAGQWMYELIHRRGGGEVQVARSLR